MARQMQELRKHFVEVNEDRDQIYMERRHNEINTTKCNPHRVRIYSLNEIWKNILARLVELKVLKDPDDTDSEDLEFNESEELEDDFDFNREAINRQGRFLKFKRYRDGRGELVKLISSNDFKLINKMLQLTAANDKRLSKLESWGLPERVEDLQRQNE